MLKLKCCVCLKGVGGRDFTVLGLKGGFPVTLPASSVKIFERRSAMGLRFGYCGRSGSSGKTRDDL